MHCTFQAFLMLRKLQRNLPFWVHRRLSARSGCPHGVETQKVDPQEAESGNGRAFGDVSVKPNGQKEL